jgi:predicted ATPase with chaperone activity
VAHRGAAAAVCAPARPRREPRMMDRSALASLVRAGVVPRPELLAPRTPEEAGLSVDLLTQLSLKTLYFSGELTGSELASRLGVMFAVIEPSLDFLKAQRHIEVAGGMMVGGASYRYRVTTDGRNVAAMFLQQDRYVGPAPVPLAQYSRYMAAQRGDSRAPVTRAEVREAFAHLVLSDSVLDEIGPAVNGGHSLFIYGPPGNGKTVMARAIRELLAGDVAVPHAIEVQGNIIRVFDPVNHEPRPQPVEEDALSRVSTVDQRWTMCRRPMVLAGGELTMEALELNYEARVGYYRAPLQLVANGGLLIVDDFGRQHCAPRDLLNRWMVPLESGVDYLTLQTGLKFEVPFQVFVAFATNIKPGDLVDEAFLRRVQYKVFAENPTNENFARIFELCCDERDLVYDRRLVDELLESYYHTHAVAPRACHPRDLINQAMLLADYRGQPRVLTAELLRTACEGYFVEDRS